MIGSKYLYSTSDGYLPWLCVAAGIVLQLLLPVGLVFGIDNLCFELVFGLHLLLLIWATILAVLKLGRLGQSCGFSGQLLLTLAVLSVALAGILGFLPVTSRDALIHHLAVPKWWLEQGRITEFSWHEWSYYPMLLNLGFFGLMKWGLVQWSPLYHLVYLILFGALLSDFAVRHFNDKRLALFSAIVAISLPVCLKLASAPLVDLGLCLYFWLGISAFIIWLKNPKRSLLLLSGISFGLALSTKYNAILALAVLVLVLLVTSSETKVALKRLLPSLMLVLLIAAFVFSPWAFKNMVQTTNPVYPLYKSFLGGQITPEIIIHTLKPLKQRISLYHENWIDLVLLPIRMILDGQDDNPRQFDGVLSPIILLMFLPLISRKQFKAGQGTLHILALFTVGYFLFAVTLSVARIRYLSPLYGPIVLLAACGLKEMLNWFKAQAKTNIFTGFLALHLAFSLSYVLKLFNPNAIGYLFGQQSRIDYLRNTLGEYQLIEAVNSLAPDISRLYLLYTGNRFYYYTPKVVSGGYNSEVMLIRLLRTSSDTLSLIEKLKAERISHFVIHAERLNDTLPALLSDQENAVWHDFVSNHLLRLKQIGPFSILSVVHQ